MIEDWLHEQDFEKYLETNKKVIGRHRDEKGYEEYSKWEMAHAYLAGCEMERWKPIETAPKDTGNKIEYILICEGNCVPDLVVWHGSRKPRLGPHDDGKAWVSDIPEGWFNVSGSRSRIMNPTHWMPLPAPPQIRRN